MMEINKNELRIQLGNFHQAIDDNNLVMAEVNLSSIISGMETEAPSPEASAFANRVQPHLNDLREAFEEMKRTYATIEAEESLIDDPSTVATNLMFGEGVEAFGGYKAEVINNIFLISAVLASPKNQARREYD